MSREDQASYDTGIPRQTLDALVMDYLVKEGHKDAAECFSRETGTDPGVDLARIDDRMAVRHAIMQGDILGAIDRINELDPHILDTNPGLHFILQKQQLIELIRRSAVDEALKFAREDLAPIGEGNPELLCEIEEVMALLAFVDPSCSLSSGLLGDSQRGATASAVNSAILTSQNQDKEARLPHLVKTFGLVQRELEDALLPEPEHADYTILPERAAEHVEELLAA